MATRLPYYVGGDDIYTQLMRQFESEVPYYSSAPASVAGGYDPSLYSRLMQPMPVATDLTGDYSGLLGGGGDFGMQSPTTSTTGTGFSLSGLLGGPAASTAAPGTVSTGLGGVSLSPAGTVTANTVSVPTAAALGLVTGLPLGLIATMSNQSATQAANALAASLADTGGVNADGGTAAATAGPGGTGGAAAAAAAAAASAAAAAGMSDAAQGAAAQAAANAVVSGMTAAEAAQAGASAAAATTTGEVGIAGLATGFTDGGTAGGDASGIAGLSTGFSDSGAIGGNADSGGGGGAAGSGGAKIICTKLHELGKMPTEIYEADQAFGAELIQNDPQAYYGYASWAQHVVRWMSRDDLFGKFVVFAAYHIATPWSEAMAQDMGVDVKSGWFGRFLMKHGLKVCRAIGEMKQDRSIQNV